MAQTALKITKDRLGRSFDYQLKCTFCNEHLGFKATISSIIMEYAPRLEHKLSHLFCNNTCLLHFRLNGNLCKYGTQGSMYNHTGERFQMAFRELQQELEIKAEKE